LKVVAQQYLTTEEIDSADVGYLRMIATDRAIEIILP
jgi:hypothetical protein